MSLVNLAHVCSHLQNASLARLGLTSIPYTKLHLSLALLLHKQGFLSQVQLGGPSPPASAFPGSSLSADNHHITSAPHRDRHPRSREAALHDVVYNGCTAAELRARGFPADSIAFALDASQLSQAQLEADGWDTPALDYILAHGAKPPAQLAAEGHPDPARAILAAADLPALLRQLPDTLPAAERDARLRARLRRRGLPRDTLAYFAGPAAARASPRHLARDGITLPVMGLDVAGQPVTTLPEEYRDPWQQESEDTITQRNRASRRLWLGLKYHSSVPVLSKARLVSKPTKRVWLSCRELGQVVRGSQAGEVKGMTRVGEVLAVSTDRGVMEARECVERRIGGQPLCRIW